MRQNKHAAVLKLREQGMSYRELPHEVGRAGHAFSSL
jgi:hypothetical protein